MNILAFDTCLDKMYVTLGSDDKIIDSMIVETTKEHYHSAFLISTIKDILKTNNLTPQDIDVVVTNIGPGSFTGIRACTTVARVFAQGIDNVKTIGVSSLEILSRLSNNEEKTLVALDARKEMAYVAVYENKTEIFAPQTVLLSDLKDMKVIKGSYNIITDDKLEQIIGGISYLQSDKNLGEFLVKIAAEKLATNCETDWRNLHPLYIQPPPITVKRTQ